jgi:hypothetical protein
MAATVAPTAQLEALRALIETAQALASEITDDATVGRLLRAFLTLPPEDRDIVACVVERGAAWHHIAEGTAELTGIRLRANPNARLFLRLVEPHDGTGDLEDEPPEILLGALRIMRQVPLLLRPELACLWRPAALHAFDMLEPTEREACVRFAQQLLALLGEVNATRGASPPA